MELELLGVLNLIINGLPSIPETSIKQQPLQNYVLNLIINGLPSIHEENANKILLAESFKPYYKWITFNTL